MSFCSKVCTIEMKSSIDTMVLLPKRLDVIQERDMNLFRVIHIFAADVLNLLRHGRREKTCLLFARCFFHDVFNIIDKAHT